MTTRMDYEALKLATGEFKNPRTHTGLSQDALCELAVNIGVNGLLNPPLVLESGLVIAGSRRYRAIGILLVWFQSDLCGCPFNHTVSCPIGSRVRAFAELSEHDLIVARATATGFRALGIPVRIMTLRPGRGELEGVALADNLQRSDLASYEIAEYLVGMIDQGVHQADLARMIGKSKSYVSRKITAWRGATASVRAAWRAGEVAEEVVLELVKLPPEDQAKALAGPVPRGRRGPANRPAIDTVKEVLAKIDDRARPIPYAAKDAESYTAGVIDALRWIKGDDTSGAFVKLMEVANVQ